MEGSAARSRAVIVSVAHGGERMPGSVPGAGAVPRGWLAQPPHQEMRGLTD